MKFHTSGYGGTRQHNFLNLVKQKEIKAVVDVRVVSHHGGMGSYIMAKSADKGIEGLLGKDLVSEVRRQLGK